MSKPTVNCVNLVYIEYKKVYEVCLTINKLDNKLEYIKVNKGKNRARMLKYAEELASLIKTEFVKVSIF